MTKCQNVSCYNGENCPISQETHDLVKNQKRKAELKRLEKCFKIIGHEIINRQFKMTGKCYFEMLDKLNSLKKELI